MEKGKIRDPTGDNDGKLFFFEVKLEMDAPDIFTPFIGP